MKNVLLATALIAVSFSAQAFNCSYNEAQFQGFTTDKQQIVSEGSGQLVWSYRIEFTSYQPSGLCPLDEVSASQTRFEASSEEAAEPGQEVSGYLVEKDGKISIDQ